MSDPARTLNGWMSYTYSSALENIGGIRGQRSRHASGSRAEIQCFQDFILVQIFQCCRRLNSSHRRFELREVELPEGIVDSYLLLEQVYGSLAFYLIESVRSYAVYTTMTMGDGPLRVG